MLKLQDSSWAKNRGPVSFQIGLATFGILALELALIRWTSGQIRVFAYFNNLLLIGAFLGMGLGVALGRRYSGLIHGTLPALLLASIPLAFAESLNITHMPFPDASIYLFVAEFFAGSAWQYIFNISLFLLIFCLLVTVFIFAGSPVGYLFSKLPPLRAYTSDLVGSLLGVVAFTCITFLNASPPVWLALGSLPFLWLSRSRVSLLSFGIVIFLGWYSINGALYSPYNRIDISQRDLGIELKVNRDYHQIIHDLSDENLSRPEYSENELEILSFWRQLYDLPFTLNDTRERALIVGAGTGNDVQAALRNGYQEIYSVDIDGMIIDIGRRLHPEKPYDDPKVVPVVNDARAFFEQYKGRPFDIVCYGFLDSHAMFSTMSSLRLDNYVYTEEGIRRAWEHVSDKGHLSLTFFADFRFPWIMDRLYWTIAEATGQEPLFFINNRYASTYLVSKQPGNIREDLLKRFELRKPIADRKYVRTTSDDWPFLYIRPFDFPLGYAIVISAVLCLTAVTVPMAFGGRKTFLSEFDPTLFLMGGAFMLIETRGVTTLSLLFGSTWMVNSAIFAGILIMVLLANLTVERFKLKDPLPWFALLFISLTFLWAFNLASLNVYPLLVRGLFGGLINAVPVGFAGIIFSILLSRSRNPTASLGSNLLGAVIGGFLEYSSMFFGLRMLVQIACILYLIALLIYRTRKGKT